MRSFFILAALSLSITAARSQSHSLLPAFQGMTQVGYQTELIADSLPVVDQFEFEVTTAAGYFVETVVSSDHKFLLSESGLQGDLQREVSVRVRTTTSGVTSPYGSTVTFTTTGASSPPCHETSDLEELWNLTPEDQAYRSWREEQLQNVLPTVSAYRAAGGGGCTVSYRIPVVFHVVYDDTDPLTDITDAAILAQLAHLNNEFNGPNPNTLGGNPCIEFCLAQNTPQDQDWTG